MLFRYSCVLSASKAPQPPFLLCRPSDPLARRGRSASLKSAPPETRGVRAAVHRHHDDGGVVEIGIMRIGVLERPAAGTHVRALVRPVADTSSTCRGASQSRPARALAQRLVAAHLDQRMARPAPCPRPARRRAGNRPRRPLTTSSLSIGWRAIARLAGGRADSRARRTSSRVLAIAGKMAPSPSSPFSRSVTKATASSIARLRGPHGKGGSVIAEQRVDAREAPRTRTRFWCGAVARARCAPAARRTARRS